MTRRLLVAISCAIAASLVALPGAERPVRADAGGSETTGSAIDDAAHGRQGRGRGGRGGGAPARKRLLAWADTRNGQAQHASVGHALAVIERLGYESGQWDTFIRTDSNIIADRPLKTDGSPASGGPNLDNVDAIFFMGHREVPLDEAQREALLTFVRDGKGFVAAHTALTAFASWPEFLDLIGARYGGHPVSGAGTIINERPDFPATRHLPASFPFDDEFYLPSEYSRDDIDILLRLDLASVEREGLREDRDYPLAWAKKYGEGRVFFGSFAHASETWDIRDIQQMYFEAIRWALRLSDAEPAPHPMRGGPPTEQTADVAERHAPTVAGANWSHPQGDAGATRFSTLDQINTSNVDQLERVWVFHTGSGRFASSPMVIDSVIYFSAPNGVFALDGVTGEQIWKYAPKPEVEEEPASGGGRGGGDNIGAAIRGPAYWPGTADVAPRIYSTTRLGLAAIDAGTGTIVTEFGENGFLLGITPDSYPVFYQNVLITAGPVEDTRGKTVKGFDAVTGQPLWTFYTKAQPGDPNRETWLNDSADTSATPDIWGMFTVDEERGTVFVPVEKVSGNGNNDYWGGGSHGNNLYSDSLVALDALTGEMQWHQQLVHHDIWDYDVAAAPTLIEVRRDGEVIPAVAQYTKMALLFIFHRETGEPIFGLEERPVPQTTVSGEWTSPTQPFPLKPPPLARNTLTRAELSKVTPEHQAFCEDLWDRYNLPDAVPYDPWRTDRDILVLPGAQGGGNWHGASFNRPLGLMFVTAMNAPQWGRLTEGGGRRGRGAGTADQAAPNTPPRPRSMSKRTPEQGRFWHGQTQWSCTEPPWNELIAIDANTGDVAWRVPLGEFEELTALGVPPTGTPTAGWGITTAGSLIFIGGTTDGFFRAFDAQNGEELWRDRLPQPAQSSPTTYMGRDGRQYVVIGANGGGFFRAPTGDEVIAYRLPSGRRP